MFLLPLYSFEKLYKSDDKHRYYSGKKPNFLKYTVLLTEDSKSGFLFFKEYCGKRNEICESAKSKSKIFEWLKGHIGENIFVIADGAAFGPEIDKIVKLSGTQNGKISLCLPESFEWLILNSGIIRIHGDVSIPDVLAHPSDYIESRKYFSWELFFEKYLIEITNNTPLKYQKNKMNPVYISENNMTKIVSEVL